MANAKHSGDTDRLRARLYRAENLAPGAAGLDLAAAHYLRDVLRLAPGMRIGLFNARDGEYAARIASFGKKGAAVTLEERVRGPERPDGDVWLVFAPIKRAHLEFQVQKATELGVSALWPVTTKRTIVERVKPERLAAIAAEAAEQSERLSVPEIKPAATLTAALAAWPKNRQMIVCDESGGGRPIAQALAGEDLSKPWAILTGPEGGFSPEEFALLRNCAFVRPVGLGPRVLRADTAALAALAVFQSLAPGATHAPRFAQD